MLSPTLAPHPLALRPRDAARAVGVSPRTLWSLLAPRGPIPTVRVGRAVLIPLDGLRAWMEREAAREGVSR